MWANSVYPCKIWSVSPFKRLAHGTLNLDQMSQFIRTVAQSELLIDTSLPKGL